MSNEKLTIAFVRRGYSASGGAEAYLKRLAGGIRQLGHKTQLLTSDDWPALDWPFGEIVRVGGKSPRDFADELEETRASYRCDVLMSLERIWSCDIYRAGDGVHRAWLERRAPHDNLAAGFMRKLSAKHREMLELEQSLFGQQCAQRVIANSALVKAEIIRHYDYPADRIDLVRNGVPVKEFQYDPAIREKMRAELALQPSDVAVLFAGSGWQRKGLRFAIDAVEGCSGAKMRLLVAGRGNERRYRAKSVQFLGEVSDLRRIYLAADIFLLPTIYDPFSNACLEALASGLPVITTAGNGFSEVIEDGVHGSIIAQPNDIAALQKALSFWSDPNRRLAARSEISRHATQFDISTSVGQTVDLLIHAASAVLTSGKTRNT